MPRSIFSVQIRVGDEAVGTTNSKHPRLNLHNKLRSQFKLESSLLLPSSFFNCSNIVSTLSVNHVCSVPHKQQIIFVTNYDKNIVTSNVNLNIITTANTNLVTLVTSSGIQSLHDISTIPYHFLFFH